MKVITLAGREAEPLDSSHFSGQGTLVLALADRLLERVEREVAP